MFFALVYTEDPKVAFLCPHDSQQFNQLKQVPHHPARILASKGNVMRGALNIASICPNN